MRRLSLGATPKRVAELWAYRSRYTASYVGWTAPPDVPTAPYSRGGVPQLLAPTPPPTLAAAIWADGRTRRPID